MVDVFDRGGPERLVSGGVWFLVLMMMSGVFWWVGSVVVSRAYGPEGYGIFNTAFSLHNFAWVVVFGGLFEGMIKYGSEYVTKSGWRLSGFFATALKYLTVIGVVLFVLLMMVASQVSDPTTKIIVYTIALSFLFSGTKDALATVLGSFQRSDQLSVINAIRSITVLAVTAVFITAAIPATYLPLSIVAATLAQLALCIYFLRTRLKKYVSFDVKSLFGGRRVRGKVRRLDNFKQFGKIFVFGSFVSLGMISFNIMKSLDIVVLKMFLDYSDVGIYSIADTASSILFYMTSFTLPLIPAISEAYAKRDKHLMEDYIRIAVKYPILIGVPLTLIIMALAQPLVVGIYGRAFEEAVLPLQILIVGTFMLMFAYNLASVLIGIGKSKLSGLMMSTAAIQYILSLFILVPRLGFVGAAFSLTMTGITLMFLVPHYLKRELGVSIYRGLSNVLLAAAIMAFVLVITPQTNALYIVIGVAASVAAFVMSLYMTGYITRDDLGMIKTACSSFGGFLKRKKKR